MREHPLDVLATARELNIHQEEPFSFASTGRKPEAALLAVRKCASSERLYSAATSYGEIARQALCPPKPSEFDSATFCL